MILIDGEMPDNITFYSEETGPVSPWTVNVKYNNGSTKERVWHTYIAADADFINFMNNIYNNDASEFNALMYNSYKAFNNEYNAFEWTVAGNGSSTNDKPTLYYNSEVPLFCSNISSNKSIQSSNLIDMFPIRLYNHLNQFREKTIIDIDHTYYTLSWYDNNHAYQFYHCNYYKVDKHLILYGGLNYGNCYMMFSRANIQKLDVTGTYTNGKPNFIFKITNAAYMFGGCNFDTWYALGNSVPLNQICNSLYGANSVSTGSLNDCFRETTMTYYAENHMNDGPAALLVQRDCDTARMFAYTNANLGKYTYIGGNFTSSLFNHYSMFSNAKVNQGIISLTAAGNCSFMFSYLSISSPSSHSVHFTSNVTSAYAMFYNYNDIGELNIKYDEYFTANASKLFYAEVGGAYKLQRAHSLVPVLEYNEHSGYRFYPFTTSNASAMFLNSFTYTTDCETPFNNYGSSENAFEGSMIRTSNMVSAFVDCEYYYPCATNEGSYTDNSVFLYASSNLDVLSSFTGCRRFFNCIQSIHLNINNDTSNIRSAFSNFIKNCFGISLLANSATYCNFAINSYMKNMSKYVNTLFNVHFNSVYGDVVEAFINCNNSTACVNHAINIYTDYDGVFANGVDAKVFNGVTYNVLYGSFVTKNGGFI